MENATAVQVDQAGGNALEDLHQLGHRQTGDGIEGLAVDVLDEQLELVDLEEPVALRFKGVDLDEVRMVEHLGHAELVLGLIEELLVRFAVDRHHLEGVMFRVRTTADV